ncbi:MAG: PAS domain-containing protein, partial [Chloroflexaceae bacterium]|nr:PAS domain-containing protein [Chloroflexaceae bacterium]
EDVLHQYKNIVSATPDAISLVDSSYTYRIVNKTYLTRTGKQYHEIVGHTVAQVIGDDVFATIVKEQLDRCLRGETIRYAQWFEFEGEGHRFVDVTYAPYRDRGGTISGVLVSTRDITDIKQAEDALHEHQLLLDAIINNAPAGLMVKDLQGTILLANSFIASLFQTNLTGKNQTDLFPPEMLATWIAEDQQILATREPMVVEECVHCGDDTYTYLITKFPLFDDDTTIFAIGSYGLDITERKRAEEALRQSEQNYRMLAHNIPDGVVFLFDRDMRFQVAAGKQLAAVGMSPEMLEGKTLSESVPPDIAAMGEPLYCAILNGTAPPELEQSYGDRVYRSQPVSLRNEQGEIVAGMIIRKTSPNVSRWSTTCAKPAI